MDVFQMVDTLLDGAGLTPQQLAEVRAIDAMSFRRRAENEEPGAVLEAVLDRLRAMLTADQRALFDRMLPGWRLTHGAGSELPSR